MTKEEIFNNTTAIAYKIAWSYRGCGIEIDDLRQMCLLGLWKAVITFKEGKGANICTYAYRVIQNEINYKLRKVRCEKNNKHLYDEIEENLTIADIISDDHDYIDDLLKRLEAEEHVSKLGELDLKDKEKDVLKLTKKGYKQVEMAKELQISQSQVNRILKRIRVKIMNERWETNNDN